MAFWTQASKTQPSAGPRQAVGPAKPLSVLLHSSSDFSTLVRLKIKLISNKLPPEVEDGDEEAAGTVTKAAASLAQLHQLIMAIESKSADIAKLSVMEVLEPPDRLQLLCQKVSAAKIYKSLMPHQAALGFTLGDVKSCISLTPLGLWETHEALQTALIKALSGSSCGTCSNSSSVTLLAGLAGAAKQQQQWMCLSRNKVVNCNLLSSKPGEMQTAALVELEARGQPPNKVLLLIKSAGSVKFRLFSPMQAVAAEPKLVRNPLQLSDTDENLIADRAKLAAAARQLDGRQVKLLPDERPAFIKSIHPRPSDPATLQEIADYWLGNYGLLLPKSYPFLVGVAGSPEAEDAVMQVPSCCAFTNLGLSPLPGSQPGGTTFNSTLQQLLQDIQNSSLQLLGSGGFTVEADAVAAAAAGNTDSLVQVSSQGVGGTAGSTATAVQPKQFSLGASWTSAKEVSKLMAAPRAEAAAASKVTAAAGATVDSKVASKPPPAPAVLTSAAAQLIGLHELTEGTHADRQQHRPVLSARTNINNFSKLKQFLEAKHEEQKAAEASARPSASFTSSSGAAAVAPGKIAATGSSTAGRGLVNRSAMASGGPPTAPTFSSRRPATSSSAAATTNKSAASKPAGATTATAKLKAALVAKAQSSISAAAAADGGVCAGVESAAATAAAPATAKRPGGPGAGQKRPAAAAGAKPPAAAKKHKAAVSNPNAAAAAAAAADKVKSAAGDQVAAQEVGSACLALEIAVAGGTGSASQAVGSTAAEAAAAATAAPKRTKTKASELDIAAVTSKVMAAYAASGGASLKGLSVPEMQCYLRAHGQRGGPTKKAEVEARLLALLAAQPKA